MADRDRVLAACFRLGGRVVPWLPRGCMYTLARAGGKVAWFFNQHGRMVATSNVAILLDVPESSARVRWLVRRLFVHHACNYVDLFLLKSMTKEEAMEQTLVLGMDRLQRVLERGKGAVVATAHLGNVEYGGHALATRGVPCAVLTETVEPAWLLDFFTSNRESFSAVVIPYEEGVFPKLVAAVKANMALGIACDWDMQGTGLPVRVGGGTLMMPAGLAMVALRARAPVVPVVSRRLPDGRTGVFVEEPLDVPLSGKIKEDVQRLTVAAGRVLERYLLRYPDQWVLFHPAWREQQESAVRENGAASAVAVPPRPSSHPAHDPLGK